VRRSYLEVARHLFSARPGASGRHPLRLALKGAAARLDPALIPLRLAPVLATVPVTYRCNLRCPFCDLESAARAATAPDEADRLDTLMRELAAFGVEAVGLTGGEPLLLPGIEKTVALGTELGLLVHLNTNATLVSRDRARGLLASGLFSINVSLDAGRAETHDAIRGRNAFQRAVRGVDYLIEVKEQMGFSTRVRLVMALGAHNTGEVQRFLDLAGTLGVDGCSFIPVHTTWSSSERAHLAAGSDAATEVAKDLLAARCAPGSAIDNSRAYLEGLQGFFCGEPMPRRCSAARTSIVIAPDDRVYPCVPAASRAVAAAAGGLSGRQLRGPSRHGRGLREVFTSACFLATLDDELCTACWWNCHRELDIALGIL